MVTGGGVSLRFFQVFADCLPNNEHCYVVIYQIEARGRREHGGVSACVRRA